MSDQFSTSSDAVTDFGRSFWRAAPTAPIPLPRLTGDAIDDVTFRLTAENVPTLCWVANGDGYIVWYNRRWHEYCGTTPEEMEGWGWQSVHDPELLPSVVERWTASIASGEPFEMTFPLRGADGVFRPFLTRVQPMRDASGAVARWFGTNTDIFDQVAAEQALRAERDRSRGVLEGMAEGFVLLDRDFRLLDINAEGLRIDGRNRDEILGRSHWEVWPGTEETEQGRLYKRVMAGVGAEQTECYYRWDDGHDVWLDVRAYPHAEGVAIFYRDIGDRKRAELVVQRSEARLSFLDRLGAATAALANADAVLAETTRLVGEHMEVSVCAYADMDADQDGFTIRGDWAAPDATSIVGHYSLADFGKLAVTNLSAGLPLVVNDNVRELAPEEAATFQSIGIAATICMPLVKEGRLTALMSIHDRVPRIWTEEELSLLREVTSRSWAHVERVGAVAELRRSEAALRELNADLERQVIERTLSRGRTWQLSPEILGVIDAQGFFEASNPALCSVLGWDEAEVSAIPFFDFVHPDDLAKTQAAWADAIERGLPALRFENRYRTKGGNWRWLSWVAVPEDDKVYCSARDVTVDKERESELAARTAERDRLWQNSQDVLVVIDTMGAFRSVNPAFTRILGWAEDEVLGRTVFDFVHPDDLEPTSGALEHAIADELPIFENRYRHKDGSWRWLSWVAAPEGELIYATSRHITAEKQREAELEQAREALRQSQKMEAVGQLTGGIAHDFNNMLAVVIGSLDLLGRRIGTGDARAKRYVDAAADGARRAALLTQRLLAFSRQQPLRPEAIDVNKLVTGMSDLIRGSLGSDVRLETVLVAGGWRTHADPNQLENVLLNLAVNARDAMPEGGRLTIETQNAHIDARYAAKHLGVPAGQYVLIAVSDSGSGMPEDVIAKAFDPFFTTKEVGKGTGLGLSQVYGFVKQSGGHVKIYSEPGQGTTVKVYLPRLISADHDGIEEEASSAMPLGESQEVILVVEDEPAVRQFSVDALTELGYRVLEADGAATAMRLLDAHPEIAMLFTDVVMPDVNGRKLADEVLKRRPDLKVLFTTGYTRNAVVHNGVLDAGVELIGKPFTVEELAAKVRDVLDGPGPTATG